MTTELIHFLSGHGRRCISVLYSYLDESGTHKGALNLCVAGYYGTKEQWCIFDDEWLPYLINSQVKIFHAKNPKCNKLRPFLASAIKKAELKAFICSTKPDVFNQYSSSQLKSQMGNAYAICAITCAWGICDVAHNNNLGSVSFAYETGQPNADFVEQALITLQRHKDPEMDIAAVAMVKKDIFPPLATADFLSHVYGAHTYNKNDSDWFNCLVSAGNVMFTELSANKLIDMSELIKHYYNSKRKGKRLDKYISRQWVQLK